MPPIGGHIKTQRRSISDNRFREFCRLVLNIPGAPIHGPHFHEVYRISKALLLKTLRSWRAALILDAGQVPPALRRTNCKCRAQSGKQLMTEEMRRKILKTFG